MQKFQLTTSRRGRHNDSVEGVTVPDISTHDLTKRSTEVLCPVLSELVFQLTTSRRGRQRGEKRWQTKWYFNSRPHEEVDYYHFSGYGCIISFQLTTSRRGRRQFLRKKFSFPNYFLCLLHIIYSYYINTIFFSTLFFAKSSFFLVRIP